MRNSDLGGSGEETRRRTRANDHYFTWVYGYLKCKYHIEISRLLGRSSYHLLTTTMAPPLANVNERAIESTPGAIQRVPKRRWVSYIWDTFDKSPEERRLLFKLDTAILTFASLGSYSVFLGLGVLFFADDSRIFHQIP